MPRVPDVLEPNESPWHLLGAAIRQGRRRKKLSQRALATYARVDDTMISHYERAITYPHASTIQLIDDALEAHGFLVMLHAYATEFDRRQAGRKDSNPSDHEDDDMERRTTMRLMAAISAAAVLPLDQLEAVRTGLGLSLDKQIGLNDLEATAYDLAYDLRYHPPKEFISQLAPNLADVQHALAHRTDLDRAGLHRVAGQMSALMAMAVQETGNVSAARRWWRTARAAADSSRDLDLQVWVRGRQALVDSAPRMAAEAVHLSLGRVNAGLLEARTAQARQQLNQGEVKNASDVLHPLDDLATRLPQEAATETKAIWGWSKERHNLERVALRVGAGDPTVYDDLTVMGEHETNPRAYAIIQMEKSLCLLRNGDVPQAVTEAATAYDGLHPAHRTTAVKAWSRRIISELPEKARALPAARELRALTMA
ncbi:helix-turn-helix domain-containing protein [Spongiactinospora gelatinilytica]|nr:helix-turn-helix transcriptional regulator [Spongiactinospora gelatinilytica]